MIHPQEQKKFRDERERQKFKLFAVSDDFGEFRAIFGILQIFGLAPYVIGKDIEQSVRSRFLVAYNCVIAVMVLWNMYESKKDPRNDLEYPNKTFLVDVAKDVVDILGNTYISFVTLKVRVPNSMRWQSEEIFLG